MDTLFISDLHLSLARPDKLELFKLLLRGPARKARALYILGDLFDQFWTGNDDKNAPNPEIIAELRRFSDSEAALFFLRGNRELVLNKGFTQLSGCTLLPDCALIDLDGKQVLIMHGDLLCTDDRKYQAFRRFVENSLVKKLFISLPCQLRNTLTQGLTPIMYKSKMRKPESIMDINQQALLEIMREYNVTELIHGHTHRPGVYEFELCGQTGRRIVLGDWYNDCQILVCNGLNRNLIPVGDYLQAWKMA